MGSWIRDLGCIPDTDPGVKNTPDLGTGSATLLVICVGVQLFIPDPKSTFFHPRSTFKKILYPGSASKK
jgi:hypothetical protein